MNKIVWSILILFLSPFLTRGQDMTKTLHKIPDVTVTALRPLGQTAQTRTRIDSIQLKEATAGSLAELISAYSPLFVKTYGLGSTATVSFRGTAASHTQVLWNGININNPMLGQVDFSLIPVWFVDKTELLHGGSSLSEGSGALGGTVSIGSSPEWDKRLYGSVMQTAGSFDTYQSLVSIGGGSKKIQGRLRYLYETAQNDFEYLNTAVPPFDRVKQTNAHYRKHGVLGDVNWNAGKGHYLSLNLWWNHAERNLPTIMSYQGKGRKESQKDDELRAVFRWKKFALKFKSEYTAGVSSTGMDYYLANMTDMGEVLNQDSHSQVLSFYNKYNFEWNLSDKTTFRFLLNADYHRVKTLERLTREGYSADRAEFGLSGSVHHRFSPSFSGYLLVREELIGGKFTHVMPSLGLEGNPLRDKNFVLRANFTRNYHQPTLNDLYWLPGGNPELKPEQGYTGDLSADYTRQAGHFTLTGGVAGYLSLIEDWIIWRPGEFRYWSAENLKEVFARGAEARLKISYQQEKLKASLSGNYAYTRTTNQKPESEDDRSAGGQLIYTPLHKGSGTLDVNYRGFYLNYLYTFTGERFTTSSNEVTRHTLPAYGLHDVSIGKDLQLKRIGFDLRVKINNLFDKDYQAILWRAMPGRNYSLCLKISM